MVKNYQKNPRDIQYLLFIRFMNSTSVSISGEVAPSIESGINNSQDQPKITDGSTS